MTDERPSDRAIAKAGQLLAYELDRLGREQGVEFRFASYPVRAGEDLEDQLKRQGLQRGVDYGIGCPSAEQPDRASTSRDFREESTS